MFFDEQRNKPESFSDKLVRMVKKILGFDSSPDKPLVSRDNAKEIIGLVTLVFLIRTFGFGLYQVPSGSMETTMLVGGRFFADKLSYLFVNPKIGDVISFNDPTYPYSSNMLGRLWQNYVWGPANWTKRIIGLPGDVMEGRIEDGKPVVYRNGVKLDEPYINKYPLVAMFKKDPSGLFQHVSDDCIDEDAFAYTFYSYDPSKPLDKQPFYRIDPRKVVPNPERPDRALIREPGKPIRPTLTNRIENPQGNYFDGSDVFYITLADDEYWCLGDNRRASHDCRFFGPIKRSLIHGRILFCIWSLDSDESWFIVDLIKHPIDFWHRVRWHDCLSWVR
jgi:signal peptidase I